MTLFQDDIKLEDIFKRLSIIPDAKNHGMILLLDWSGSMANVIAVSYTHLTLPTKA